MAMPLPRSPGAKKPMREIGFDAFPAAGKIRIARRQRPDGMQVFRQDHDGFDRERTLVPRDTERHPQGAEVLDHRRGSPISERDREEIGAPWNEVATVSDHLRILSRIS